MARSHSWAAIRRQFPRSRLPFDCPFCSIDTEDIWLQLGEPVGLDVVQVYVIHEATCRANFLWLAAQAAAKRDQYKKERSARWHECHGCDTRHLRIAG